MLFPTELAHQPLHLFFKQLPHVAQAGLQLSITHLASASHVLETRFNGKMATQSHSFPEEPDLKQLSEYTLMCVWSLTSIPNIQWFQVIIS